MVASGKVHNTNNGSMIHSRPLPSGYMRVQVDYAIEELTALPIPLDNGEASVIKDAIGTIVLWPTQLIIIDMPVLKLV